MAGASPVLALVAVALLGSAAAGPSLARSSKPAVRWQSLAAKKPIPITKGVSLNNTSYSTPMLIAKYGYPSETHTIKTSDGYLLSVHRVPNPGKPVMYLQHGLLSSSADWVVLGPEKALAFALYDAGYDVWIGNFRGNTYSRAHEKLSPSDAAFWDFSWHEMGMHDIPAMIDYMLEKTRKKTLVYIGHSQGTTAFLVTASMRPEYNRKVSAFIAMAPVAYLANIRSLPLKLIAKAVNEVEFISNIFGNGEFMPSNSFMSFITSKICKDGSLLQTLCTNTLFVVSGYDSQELDTEKLPDILMNVPAGASTKQFIHYGQLINSDKFRQYDFGFLKNLWAYGSINPPDYPLHRITTRVYLHYADNDLLAVPKAAKRLRNSLVNVKLLRKVPFEKFNHLDFLYARGTRPLLYDQVMGTIREVLAQKRPRRL